MPLPLDVEKNDNSRDVEKIDNSRIVTELMIKVKINQRAAS